MIVAEDDSDDVGVPVMLEDCTCVGLARGDGVDEGESVAPWLVDGVDVNVALKDGVRPWLADTLGETLGVGVTVSTFEVVCDDVTAVEAL